MSDPKRAGDLVRDFVFDYARRHNRPDIYEAFEEGASIWTDNPHPNAWMTKEGIVKPEPFSKAAAAREARLEKAYEEGRLVKKFRL